MVMFYCYIGLIVALLSVVVWLIKLAYKEVQEYRECVKEIRESYDLCEYFDKTRRLVASIETGDGRKTIVGTAKFSDSGKMFAICTDDNEYISSEVLSEHTVAKIEEAEKEVK